MDYKELWCEIFEEMKAELGDDPDGYAVDQALADRTREFGDGLREMLEAAHLVS